MDYVETHARVRTLPPLFPIVLYNGDNPWRAPTTMAEPEDRSDLLGPYQVTFEYFKIAENELDRETLLTVSNIVSTLFLAEANYDLSLLKTALLDIFDNESDKQAVNRDDDSGNPSYPRDLDRRRLNSGNPRIFLSVASGIYLYRVTSSPGFVDTKRMTLLK